MIMIGPKPPWKASSLLDMSDQLWKFKGAGREELIRICCKKIKNRVGEYLHLPSLKIEMENVGHEYTI